jgi:ubiquinone/menaquinone biosynthesis C-methylase UbiE
MLANEKTAGFYDEDAALYDELRFTSRVGRLNHTSQIELLNSLLPEATRKTVEVGSGTGRFTKAIAARTDDFLIVDVARQMLVEANKAVPVARPLMGDATDLPLRSDSVDTLVCLNVLNHIPAFQEALAEFGRVLKSGGYLLANFNNIQSPYFVPGLIVNQRRRAFRADVFSHWQSWGTFLEALDRAGFEIENARGHLPIPGRTPGPFVRLASQIDRLLRVHPRYSPAPILLATKVSHPDNPG